MTALNWEFIFLILTFSVCLSINSFQIRISRKAFTATGICFIGDVDISKDQIFSSKEHVLFAKPRKRSNSKTPVNDDEEIIDEVELEFGIGKNTENAEQSLKQTLPLIRADVDQDSTSRPVKKNSSPTLTKPRHVSSLGTDSVEKQPVVDIPVSAAWRGAVTRIVEDQAKRTNITIVKLIFIQNRIEVTLTNGAIDDGDKLDLNAEQLRQFHRDLYTQFETVETELAIVSRFEVNLFIMP